ncbi:hypothetical protein [Methyloligella solikamskensis]|uniref:Terminase small subunit n=1 Tax=Methyloligella solikamskensis TaxID=1177756 RepID=A0ABW3J7M1_9HYPH
MIADRRRELDEQIEALARTASRSPYELLRRQCLAVVSDTMDFIREATGTMPPQCQPDIDRAFKCALDADAPRTLHALQQALDITDRLLMGVTPPPPQQPTVERPRKADDPLLKKLRTATVPSD